MSTIAAPTSSLRILHRVGNDQSPCRFFAAKKPSLLDLRLAGDAWVACQGAESLGIFVGNLRLATISGTALEWMTLNNILCNLRRAGD